MSSLDQVRSINEQYRKLDEEAGKIIKAAVLEAAQSVFDKHPKVKSFSVHGYHPSFNDGEPCSFSFCHEAYTINGGKNPEYGGDDDDDDDDDDEGNKHRPKGADWEDGMAWDDKYTVKSKVAEPGWAAAANADIEAVFAVFTDGQIEAAFDSNFELKFKRGRGGKVKMEKDYYDCGY